MSQPGQSQQSFGIPTSGAQFNYAQPSMGFQGSNNPFSTQNQNPLMGMNSPAPGANYSMGSGMGGGMGGMGGGMGSPQGSLMGGGKSGGNGTGMPQGAYNLFAQGNPAQSGNPAARVGGTGIGGYAPGQGVSGYNPLMFGGGSAPIGGYAPGQGVLPGQGGGIADTGGAGNPAARPGGYTVMPGSSPTQGYTQPSAPPPSFGPFPPTQGGADYGSGTNPAWQNFLGGGANPNAAGILDQRYQDYLRNSGAPTWTASGGR